MAAALIALRVRGNLGQFFWILRRYLERALMRLMLCLRVDISSSESSEGIIGLGYENVVVLPLLLVKRFGKGLRTVSSPNLSVSCAASLSSSLSHIESLSADGSVSLFLILWFHNPCKASPAEGVGSL